MSSRRRAPGAETPDGEQLRVLRAKATRLLSTQVRDAHDRLIASDPGRARLRQGLRAIVAVGSAMLLEWALASITGRPVVPGLLLGAVVAMLMSTGIRERRRRVIVITAALCPVVAAAGASLGVLTAQHHLLALTVFVVTSFAAVWVRRFGPRGFTLGFLGWQGFFFALFLHPPVAELPHLLLAIAVSGGWVAALLLTVLYDDPQVTLRRIVDALRARARAGIAAALDVVGDGGTAASVRRLRRQLIQLREIALLLDGQLADSRALPDGVSAGRMRRWTVDVEIGMDEVADAVQQIAGQRDRLAPAALAHVRALLESLGWADAASARRSAQQVADRPGEKPDGVARLAVAALLLIGTVERWTSGGLTEDSTGRPAPGTDPLDDTDEFESVVTLVSGNLPGSAVFAQQAISRRMSGRLSPSSMRLTTRQAVQAAVAAALAIAVGELISPQRFYWAVIAAFVAYAGTATSGETVRKGVGRVGGTVLGLVASVALANITDGHRSIAVIVILACIFCAFFFQTISYGAMIFFITVVLGQLYALLGTFSDELLLIRLAETVCGAVIGVLVALVVLPTHSRATLRIARQTFLAVLGELADACADVLSGLPPERDLLALTVSLDAAGRQLVHIRSAMTRGRLFGADRVALRHRISVLGTAAAAARALAVSVGPIGPDPAAAAAAREIAAEARRLAEAPELGNPPPLPAGSPNIAARVRTLVPESAGCVPGPVPTTDANDATDPSVGRPLRRLSDALGLLAR